MAGSKHLAKGLLEKEEIFLQEIKRKLMEQLNRLKLEEFALQSILASEDSNVDQQSQQTIVPLNFESSSNTVNTNQSPDDASALNEMPLDNLDPDSVLGMTDIEYEEENEEQV